MLVLIGRDPDNSVKEADGCSFGTKRSAGSGPEWILPRTQIAGVTRHINAHSSTRYLNSWGLCYYIVRLSGNKEIPTSVTRAATPIAPTRCAVMANVSSRVVK